LKENKITFSIVIPAYNSAEFIGNALTSCLKQTLLPKEIIVIDDCSSDQTREVVQKFKSPLIRLLINSTNKGPSFSRNLGIKGATSSWILFLDADDIFHEKKLETLNILLLEDLSISAIGHNTKIGLDFHELNEIIISSSSSYKKYSTFSLLLKNRIVTPALGVSSKNGILFNENMKYAEDHDFIVRTASICKMTYFDLPLCSIKRMPLTPGGLSSDFNKMRIGEIRMYLNFCRRNNLILIFPMLALFSSIKHLVYLLKLELLTKNSVK
jgi:glycosyltransferase involved in cell wall biosynthesis